MAEAHVLFALRHRYARVLGTLVAQAGDPIKLTADLAHLAAVLRMFSPREDVAAIAPVRPWKRRRGSGRATWTLAALDVLRTANEPLTTRQIARRIADRRGVTDPATLYSIECSLHVTLANRQGAGVLRAEGSPKRWSID
jgi:hypothetical protein